MAKPNHTTGSQQIYDRLVGDLVPTYASSVYRGVLPEGGLPQPGDKPAVVFDMNADYSETSFKTDIASIDLAVYVIRHAQSSTGDADTVVGRVIGDGTPSGSTHGLHRWSPSVAGIDETPLRIVGSGEGQYDTQHAAHVLRFETWFTEG